MIDVGARVEKAYLLPAPLSKAQFGAWFTAALDEGLVNRGECVWQVQLWLDFAQLRREPQPFNAWRPRGVQEPLLIPSEDQTGEWPMSPSSILGFREVEGLILQIDTKSQEVPLTFLAFDARCFDEQLEWKSLAARDRLLHLVSRALSSQPDQSPASIEARASEVEAARALQQRLRAKAS